VPTTQRKLGPGSEQRARELWQHGPLTNITCPSATWKCARGGPPQQQMAQLCIPGEHIYLFHFVRACLMYSFLESERASIPLLLLLS